jgi:hypothetical protein
MRLPTTPIRRTAISDGAIVTENKFDWLKFDKSCESAMTSPRLTHSLVAMRTIVHMRTELTKFRCARHRFFSIATRRVKVLQNQKNIDRYHVFRYNNLLISAIPYMRTNVMVIGDKSSLSVAFDRSIATTNVGAIMD